MAIRTPSPAELERRRTAADAKLQATHERIVEGVQQLVGGQEWANYLRFAAKFHDYSFNNTVLIWAQAPRASYVAGYQAWLQLGRQVRKGEQGISILAPVLSRRNQPVDQGGAGHPATPPAPAEPATEPGKRRIVGVRNATIFDVSQTDPVVPGQELPLMQPALLQGDVAPQLWDALAAHVAGQGFTVERGDCRGANGVTMFEPRIVRVRDDVSTLQAVKTLAHELGHVLMHNPPGTETGAGDCRGIVEVEAESVAFMVLASQGLDTADYTFPYLARWAAAAADQEAMVAAVRDTGNRVIAASRDIIGRLEPAEHIDADQAADLATRTQQSVQTLTDAAPVVRAPAGVGPIFTDPSRELGAVTAATLSYFQDYGRLDIARDYLAGRGIAEVADGFCVGYAPIGGGLVAHLKQLGFDESVQLAAGVARTGQDGRLTDVFRDRVVAVIADGPTIAGFVGRAVQPDKTPKYLNSPATELFDKGRLLFGLTEGADRLRRGGIPVLVEGPMDALAIAQFPSNLVPVAASGTAITDRHLAALAQLVPSKRIIVALDGDPAGRAASRTVGEKLAAAGWLARIPADVPGKDPAQLAAENGREVLTWLHPSNCQPLIYRTVADTVAQYDISEAFFAQQAARAASVYLIERYPAGRERDHGINLAHDLCHIARPAATRYLDTAPTQLAVAAAPGGATAGYADRTYRPPQASTSAALSR